MELREADVRAHVHRAFAGRVGRELAFVRRLFGVGVARLHRQDLGPQQSAVSLQLARTRRLGQLGRVLALLQHRAHRLGRQDSLFMGRTNGTTISINMIQVHHI